ncbi:MAG: zinc ribbon domain-containing protein [Candidatus Hodarchaeota archaeon]
MFEADYYKSKFSCPKCDDLMIPIRVAEDKKNGEADIITQCPDCHNKYQFSLSLEKTEVDKWRKILKDMMFKCSECGKGPLTTLKVHGNEKKDWKIKVECMDCDKKRERVIDADLYFLVEEGLPEADIEEMACPTCGEKILSSADTCPKCGREINCGNCKSHLALKAKFCTKCGESIELGDFSQKPLMVSDDHSGICPVCGNVLTERNKFCNVCGQEIICDKCHEILAAGAIFCHVCGDRVRAGKKL